MEALPPAEASSQSDTDIARAELERQRDELELLRRECAQFKATCENLNKKLERLDRALERTRKYSLVYRLQRLFMPRLGTFIQYRPREIDIPQHYLKHEPLAAPPAISMVTPSFQHAAFLERTMCSVLDQQYPRLEYIVQDGGSRDGTAELLDRYRPRLKAAVSQKDRGQAHAVNLGFAHATGELMAYLNSDDLLLPGALHYVAAYFRAHPEVDVVYGQRVVINAQDQEVGRWVLPEHEDQMLLWADYVPQETLFWRRRIWEKTGGKVDESFQFALDWDLLLRFREAGARMACLPRFLGAFRIHALQKTLALIENVGYPEMNRLRRKYLGREPSGTEIARALRGYMRRAWWREYCYRHGLLKL